MKKQQTPIALANAAQRKARHSYPFDALSVGTCFAVPPDVSLATARVAVSRQNALGEGRFVTGVLDGVVYIARIADDHVYDVMPTPAGLVTGDDVPAAVEVVRPWVVGEGGRVAGPQERADAAQTQRRALAAAAGDVRCPPRGRYDFGAEGAYTGTDRAASLAELVAFDGGTWRDSANF